MMNGISLIHFKLMINSVVIGLKLANVLKNSQGQYGNRF